MLWTLLCRPKKAKNNICKCSLQHASELICSDCGGYTSHPKENSAVIAMIPQKSHNCMVPLNSDE